MGCLAPWGCGCLKPLCPSPTHPPQAPPSLLSQLDRRASVLGVGDSSSSTRSLQGEKDGSWLVPGDKPEQSWRWAGSGEHGWRAVAGEAELCRGRCSLRRRCPLLLPELLLFASLPGKLCAVGWGSDHGQPWVLYPGAVPPARYEPGPQAVLLRQAQLLGQTSAQLPHT